MRLITYLLKKRYGLVHAIRSPIGWPPWEKPSLRKRMAYGWKRAVYRVDKIVFHYLGGPIRKEWKDSFVEDKSGHGNHGTYVNGT